MTTKSHRQAFGEEVCWLMRWSVHCSSTVQRIIEWFSRSGINFARVSLMRLLYRLYSTFRPPPDPFALVAPHLARLRSDVLNILPSGHPALSEITKYYFLHPSKQIRPVLVLLFSLATNGLGGDWPRKLSESNELDLDRPLTRPDVLNDWNPSMPTKSAKFDPEFTLPVGSYQQFTSLPVASKLHRPSLTHSILPAQLRLAQIVEMLHTASLLHDDVIDASPLRRGAPSAPSAFSAKAAVLGGNFILGRASAALARLGDDEVTELIASVLSNLVDGEILQMKKVKLDDTEEGGRAKTSREAWNIYLQKTYLKTASLMAKGARSAVVLGGCKEGEIHKEIAYAYGRNLGIAFQV